jgi:hypothetical protein
MNEAKLAYSNLQVGTAEHLDIEIATALSYITTDPKSTKNPYANLSSTT